MFIQSVACLFVSLFNITIGECTFVEKARIIHENQGNYGLLVNSDNTLIDLPAGKENTTLCQQPFSIARESDGKCRINIYLYFCLTLN